MAVFTLLDWMIIGGGIHGTYLSHVLVNALGTDPDGVRVLDDAPTPLAAWTRRTRACGMTYLRSPQAHHLDLRTDSLRRHARQWGLNEAFIEPYRRPALDLFDCHARHVLEHAGLEDLRLTGRARRLAAVPGGYRIETDAERLRARRVLLAPGPPAPYRPEWAQGLPHAFDPGFEPGAHRGGHVAVVGGGATGAQLALALAEGGASVDLVARGGVRQADFDSHPCYLGPRCLRGFAWHDPARRRRAITAARQPGTLPREVYAGVRAHQQISLVTGEIAGRTDNGLRLADGRTLTADRVLLATGLANALPGGRLVREAMEGLNLPLAEDGWPLPAPDLQWRTGLYVTGRLAELALGPAAGNISGARMAGRRLMEAHTSAANGATLAVTV